METRKRTLNLIRWAAVIAACSVPFWWFLPRGYSVAPSPIPFDKLLQVNLYGSGAIVEALLRFFVPLVPAGAALAFLHAKTRLYQAAILGAALGGASLLRYGVFNADACAFGLIGCAIGFWLASLLQKDKPELTKQAGTILGIASLTILLSTCLLGGGQSDRLSLSSAYVLPEDISLAVELPEDDLRVATYRVDNSGGLSATFDVRLNEVEADNSFEDWERIGRVELESMGSFLPEIYALRSVTESYILHFLPAIEGLPVYGCDILLSYDEFGRPGSIESPVTEFLASGSIQVRSAAGVFKLLQEGGANYSLDIEGRRGQVPASLTIEECTLSYMLQEETGRLLPCWTFSGTARYLDDTVEPFILQAEAIV